MENQYQCYACGKWLNKGYWTCSGCGAKNQRKSWILGTTEQAKAEITHEKGTSYRDLKPEQRKKLHKRKSNGPSLFYILFMIIAAFIMYQVMWK